MIDILQKAASEAGEMLKKYFLKEVSISYKGSHQNLLTEADLISQKIIQSSILKSMIKKGYKKNDVGFIGEENLNTAGRYKFIIDPIDGTSNFASGIDYFCISIGFMQDDKLLAGLIYKPTENLYYLAEKNKGAYVIANNNIRIKLSIKPLPLKDCILATHLHENEEIRKKEINLIQKLFGQVRAIRIYASLALDICNLAVNKFQIVVTAKYNIWDVAAAKIIIEESGGKFVDWHGKKPIFNLNEPNKIYQLISCHPKILPQLIKLTSNI